MALRAYPQAADLLIADELKDLRFEPTSDRQGLYIEARAKLGHRFGLYLEDGVERRHPCKASDRLCDGEWSAGIRDADAA